jgi:hypothetical protein
METSMDMDRFVERRNIARFTTLLMTETDTAKRELLQKLLTDEMKSAALETFPTPVVLAAISFRVKRPRAVGRTSFDSWHGQSNFRCDDPEFVVRCHSSKRAEAADEDGVRRMVCQLRQSPAEGTIMGGLARKHRRRAFKFPIFWSFWSRSF